MMSLIIIFVLIISINSVNISVLELILNNLPFNPDQTWLEKSLALVVGVISAIAITIMGTEAGILLYRSMS